MSHQKPLPESSAVIELIAQWLGERESTHLWPEIHETDKACYRTAARELADAISTVDQRISGTVEWKAGEPPYIDLWLPGGRRLTGWLDSRSKVAVHLPEPDKTSADSDIYWDAEWAPIKDVDGENGAQVAVYGDAVEIGCARYFPDAARMLAAQLLAGAALADNAGGAE